MDIEQLPGPHTYVRLTLASWWNNLPLVLLAGLVFSVLCAPALSLFVFALFGPALLAGALLVAPAWVALLAQLTDVARDVPTGIGVMFRALVRYWPRAAVMGLLVAFPALAFMLTVPALARETVPVFVWVAFGMDGLVALVVLAMSLYATPLFVLYDMGVRHTLRNAMILAPRHLMNTIGLLGLLVLFVMATIYVHSALVMFWPAFWGLFVVNNCRMVVASDLGAAER